MQVKYTSSVNSVLYFVQLPYLLNDPAVIKSYEGTQKVLGETYEVLKVTFRPSGGGEDFQDEYRYRFHEKTRPSWTSWPITTKQTVVGSGLEEAC